MCKSRWKKEGLALFSVDFLMLLRVLHCCVLRDVFFRLWYVHLRMSVEERFPKRIQSLRTMEQEVMYYLEVHGHHCAGWP